MWKQAQLDQWNKTNAQFASQPEVEQESSGEEYSDDDDYAPIQMASWGTQTVDADGTTNVNLTATGWASLIDPNVKISANGLGSGQLHRKGAHYIPLSENLIVNQRLGKPIPKAVGGKKKKSKPKAAPPKPHRPAYNPPVYSPAPSSIANRSRAAITSGAWAAGSLSSTPFWESTSKGNDTQAQAPPPPRPSAPVQNPYAAGNLATQPFWEAPAKSAPPGLGQNPQFQSFQSQVHVQPTLQPVQPVQPAQYAQPTQSFNQPPPARPMFDYKPPTGGSAASKYAPSSVRKAVEETMQNVQPMQTQPMQTQPMQTQPMQTQPMQTQPLLQTPTPAMINHNKDTPVINFNIELSPGVVAKLAVYQNDNPLDVVNRFEKNHHLTISDDAKIVFARKVEDLLQQYKQS